MRRIGKGWKDVILCQPTIKYAEVTPECGLCASEQADPTYLYSQTGLTLGDLLAEVKKAFERGCVWFKLQCAANELPDGWEYEMSPEEAYEEIGTLPLDSVLIAAYLE